MIYLSILIAFIATIATLACAIIAWLERKDRLRQNTSIATPVCLTVLGANMHSEIRDLPR